MLEILKEGTLVTNAAHNLLCVICYNSKTSTTKSQEMHMSFSHYT